ncbi:MAG: hypothetical protein IPP19_17005 [Verrucomicrobia bacterium]|nr:hypothetical protein [Verrucomicrobiota bacterium]
MKNYKSFVCAVWLLVFASVSQALTIKISGDFESYSGPNAYTEQNFGIVFDYDPSFSPEYVPTGTLVSGVGVVQQDFYLFSLDGIRNFSAYAGNASTNSGSWSGMESPSDGIQKLWFDVDFRTPGINVQRFFFGGFSSPDLTISFGSWLYVGMTMDPAAVDDVFIHNPYLGFSPGNYTIKVVPDYSSTGWLLIFGLAGLACFRAYKMVRSKSVMAAR